MDILVQLGQAVRVLRNDEEAVFALNENSFDSIMISPGPGRPEESGCTNELIRKFSDRKPIFGVCLGQQALGIYFGAKLEKAELPMHGKVSRIKHYGHPLFKGVPEVFSAMRYHSLILKTDSLFEMDEIAHTEKGELMAIAHKNLKIAAVQFHPESVLSPDGKRIIFNWFEWIKERG